MKSIRIKDSKDFDRLLEALVSQYIHAESMFRLRASLVYELNAQPRFYEAAKNFWYLTLNAYGEAVLLSLSRIYDQDNGSLNLRRLLLTIRDNLYVFDEADFHERFKGDPFVDTLARSAGKPEPAQLDAVFLATDASDPLVAKLDYRRNRLIVHNDPRNILGYLSPADAAPLTEDDMKTLLHRADTIVNRYRELFKGVSMWRVIAGGVGDYKNLLKNL